ncbi:immunoglobulin superfamily member 1-like [Mauremys mutica]|uniref:immunoglobulin superfamily member 1-like n=1 Tax=Mauremys mutica TaxID=74926 RepID=UPI001D15FE92|nr:immunoglobulin superfamily member 1-like [Mauremys mutica]
MALTLLLPLMARLPAPTLSQYPGYTVYLPGERVTLTCSAPGGELDWIYRFFYQKGQQKPRVVQHPSEGPQLELTAEKGKSGRYTCVYRWQESSREISSRNSDSVSITVTDPPSPPTLSLSPPHQLYLTGESVWLTCSAPPSDHTVTGFQFSRAAGQIISSDNSDTHTLSYVTQTDTGSYTCAYWVKPSGRRMKSAESPAVSISVTDPDLAPQLSVSPQQPVYITGEAVTLTCSAARASTVSGVRFFRDHQKIHSKELPSPRYSYIESFRLSGGSGLQAGVYSCESWKTVSGREMPLVRSQPISIALTDSPPQPVLELDPPSGAVSEGLPLLIICTTSRNARERRFHFYKDRVEIIHGDMGSEISTTEPGTGSMNVSVLSIPQAGPNNTGEFTCGYEENVGGRWIPSSRSRAVNVTVNVTGTASHYTRDVLLTTGGILFLVGAIAALICYCRRKKRVPKPQKSTKGYEPRVCARNLHPAHDNQGSKARVPGAEQVEQGSEVTYALMEFPALEAQATQPKNKPKPAEAEHVLYSEVVTTHTRKAAK